MVPTWITQEQKMMGIDGQSLISAITLNWERKKPFKLAVLLGLLTKTFISSLGNPILDLHLIQKAQFALLTENFSGILKNIYN